MTKYRKGEKHQCDDTCKVNHTTNNVRKTKLKSKPKVNPIITDVYNADYSLIDETIDNIKKTSRSICVDIYSSNNVYLILQDALKKVTLADK